MKLKLKKNLYGISSILGCLFFCILFLILSNRGYFVDRGMPVAKEDVALLCRELNAVNDPICSGDKKVYPEDFSPLIEKKFVNSNLDFQNVQSTLGRFYLDKRTNFKYGDFEVWYDLNRDGNYDVWMTFEGTLENNHLINISFREDIGF